MNEPSNLTELMPVIDIEGVMCRIRRHYNRGYMTAASVALSSRALWKFDMVSHQILGPVSI